MLSTSRRPTPYIRRLCRDLARTIPNVTRINRGKLSFSNLVEKTINLDVNRLLLIERWKGNPGRMNFYQVESKKLKLHLSFLLKEIKTQLEFGRKKKLSTKIALVASPKLSKKMTDLTGFLSRFFEIPVVYTYQLTSIFTAAMHLTFMPNEELKLWFTSPPFIDEIGPRIVITKIVYGKLEENSL